MVCANNEALVQGRARVGPFECLRRYGKCLVEKPLLTGDSALFDGLEMEFEVWNAGLFSGSLFSAVGPIKSESVNGTMPDDPATVVAGLAFSAAGLSPARRQYPALIDCFHAAQEAANSVDLCIRVTVTDRRTGEMALVWQSRKETKYRVNTCAQLVHDSLPGGSFYLRSTGWTGLHRLDWKRSFTSANNDKGQEEISAYVGLALRVLPGQEGVSEPQKKYVAGIAPNYHSSFGELIFKTPKVKTVAIFLRSLLE